MLQNEPNLDDVGVQNEQHSDEVHNAQDLDVGQNEQNDHNVVQTVSEATAADVKRSLYWKLCYKLRLL